MFRMHYIRKYRFLQNHGSISLFSDISTKLEFLGEKF